MGDEDQDFIVEYDLEITECPCGSGKKARKCCGYVKPRTHSVRLDKRNYMESDGIAIGLDSSLKRVVGGNLLPIIGEPLYKLSHARESNVPKTIFKGTTDGEYVMAPNSVFHIHEHVFAIDTNTRTIDGNAVSMAGVIHAYLDGEQLKYGPISVFEFWDAEITSEILGWYALIQSIVENNFFDDKNIGIIIDHNLGDLEKYNNREIAISGDYFLPENMTLIYASADKAAGIANMLIKFADRVANTQFERIIMNVDASTLKDTTYPCRYFRQWED